MILPTKGIDADRALLAVGGEILRTLNEPKTVSRLWEEVRDQRKAEARLTFDWFVLSMDLLYIFGLINLDRGRVSRTHAGVP